MKMFVVEQLAKIDPNSRGVDRGWYWWARDYPDFGPGYPHPLKAHKPWFSFKPRKTSPQTLVLIQAQKNKPTREKEKSARFGLLGVEASDDHDAVSTRPRRLCYALAPLLPRRRRHRRRRCHFPSSIYSGRMAKR